MIYNANVTQGCSTCWDMQVSVEADTLKEAEQMILDGDFEVEYSEIQPAIPDGYAQIHCYTFQILLEKIEKRLDSLLEGNIDLGMIKDLKKEINYTLNDLAKNDIEIHSWEKDYDETENDINLF